MSGSREIFFHLKRFCGTDICHSDAKSVHVKFKNFFLLVKSYFLEFPNFFTTKCLVDQKLFLQLVEKCEKLQLNLPEQH